MSSNIRVYITRIYIIVLTAIANTDVDRWVWIEIQLHSLTSSAEVFPELISSERLQILND